MDDRNWWKYKSFWEAVFGRALRSFFQGMLWGIGENIVVWDFNWKIILGASFGMAIVSVATSVAIGIPEYKEGNDEA